MEPLCRQLAIQEPDLRRDNYSHTGVRGSALTHTGMEDTAMGMDF